MGSVEPLASSAVEVSPAAAAAADLAAVASPAAHHRKRFGWLFWVCVGCIVLTIFGALFANLLPLPNPNFQNYSAVNVSPSWSHLLGTDDLGRDIFSRIVYGSRVSLIVGFGGVAIGLLIGGTTAMISGYRRGVVDGVLNPISYVFLAFPPLVGVITIITFWGHALFKITLVIGIFSAPLIYRIVRAATLSYATRDFVTAARAQGAGDLRILFREILPNILALMVSFSLIAVAGVIVLEGSLAFLGLSIPGPTPSWGNMLNEGTSNLTTNPWLTLFPALAMFIFLLAINLVGDRLREFFDVSEVKL